MLTLMNHREIEYETKKRWNRNDLNIQDVEKLFDNEILRSRFAWLQETGRQVFCEDLLLDYGEDCLRCYLMFEKTPKADDEDLDSWEECNLEGVYKFLGKYRRMILVALDANEKGEYSDMDVTDLIADVAMMQEECKAFLEKDNTMPNRHNAMCVCMEGMKKIQKKLQIGALYTKAHSHDIEMAVPHAEEQQNTVVEKKLDVMSEQKCNPQIIELCQAYIRLMAPFAPYLSEALWQKVCNEETCVLQQKWEQYKIIESQEKKVLTIPVQVNAKTKRILHVNAPIDRPELEEKARLAVASFLKPGQNYRVIYVEDRIINFVEN